MGTLWVCTANAVIIVDSGIDSVTKHFVIDGAISTVTHNPGGLVYIDPSSNAQSYAVSGELDATFSHYWTK